MQGVSVHGLAVRHLHSYVNLCHNLYRVPVRNKQKHPELDLFKEPHSATIAYSRVNKHHHPEQPMGQLTQTNMSI